MASHSRSKDSQPLPLYMNLASAALGGCTADIFTFPLDTIKVWLMVRGEGGNTGKSMGESGKNSLSTATKQSSAKPPSTRIMPLSSSFNNTLQQVRSSHHASSQPGIVGTLVRGVRTNGVLSLYGGLAAGLQRQVAFCAIRFGLYDTVKAFYQNLIPGKPEGKQIPQRILAGTTTAFIAVALFQPTEVVKIRMQAQTTKPKADWVYPNCRQAYRMLFKSGLSETWKGTGTNMVRLGVVNVSELVTYDIVKELILDYKLLNDNPVCHFTSAFIAGFITTLVASPVDVVKTRYMNSAIGQYKGPLDCASKMLVREGLRAFYKGFVPAYLRLGSWNIVMFLSYEQYKIASRHLLNRYRE